MANTNPTKNYSRRACVDCGTVEGIEKDSDGFYRCEQDSIDPLADVIVQPSDVTNDDEPTQCNCSQALAAEARCKDLGTIADLLDAPEGEEVAALKLVLAKRDQLLDTATRWQAVASEIQTLHNRAMREEIEQAVEFIDGRTHAKAVQDREALEQRLTDVKARTSEQETWKDITVKVDGRYVQVHRGDEMRAVRFEDGDPAKLAEDMRIRVRNGDGQWVWEWVCSWSFVGKGNAKTDDSE